MGLKKLFKRKKSASPVSSTSATAPNIPTRSTCATQSPTGQPGRTLRVSPPVSAQSISARLWNDAYETIQDTKPDLVKEYEKVLCAELGAQATSAGKFDPVHGLIYNDREERAAQMRELVDAGLKRSRKHMDAAQNVSEGIRAIFVFKGVVDNAVQACPQAAVAWVGICFALELFMNPGNQSQANRDGIAYVLSKMDWYWHLSEALLDENVLPSHKGLGNELEKHLIALYRLLLLFQMRSAHRYYHQVSSFVQDLVKWDDWDNKLAEIKAAEQDFVQISEAYSRVDTRMRLASIEINARNQYETLEQMRFLAMDDRDRQCRFELFGGKNDGARHHIRLRKEQPIQEVYDWIFTDATYLQWAEKSGPRLLWINGDPGQGKTMLLCGIIDGLTLQNPNRAPPAYFFCQASDVDLSTGAAVLLGLICLLTERQPSLMRHVRAEYDVSGPKQFQGAGAWHAAAKIFSQMLDDPSLRCDTIIIDALDEYVDQRERGILIRFIVEQSSRVEHIKWLVSSRRWPEIEGLMKGSSQLLRLSLDPTKPSSLHAIDLYIKQKVKALSEHKEYDVQIMIEVTDYLRQHANGTYLWVAIACQKLDDVASWEALDTLRSIPQDLEDVYKSMLNQINAAHLKMCRAILSHALLAQRPLHQMEIQALVEELESLPSHGISEAIARCRSFLTIRDNIVYWIHQSAREYLQSESMSAKIFPGGDPIITHYSIATRSLNLICQRVHRDMWEIVKPGTLIASLEHPCPDPLQSIAYSCLYWVHHLHECESRSLIGEESRILPKIKTLMSQKFLYWVEAMSLLNAVPQSIVAMSTLQSLLKNSVDDPLLEIVQDALRFLRYHLDGIRAAPLQAYYSALLFSPTHSKVRSLFAYEEPTWHQKPVLTSNWNPCLQILEGHQDEILALAFSPCGSVIASASWDGIVRLWDALTGQEKRRLNHTSGVYSIAFSPDGSTIACGTSDGTIWLWDPSTGHDTRMLEGNGSSTRCLVFSPNKGMLASALSDMTIRLWNFSTGQELHVWSASSGNNQIAFLQSGLLAIASGGNTIIVCLCDPITGQRIRQVECPDLGRGRLAFSPDGSMIISTEDNYSPTMTLWDTLTGKKVRTLSGQPGVIAMAFSLSGLIVASTARDLTIRLWNTLSGLQTSILKQSDEAVAISVSPDGSTVASGSDDLLIRLWDARGVQDHERRPRDGIFEIVFSPDGSMVATSAADLFVRLWDVSTGREMQALYHECGTHAFAFNPTFSIIVSASVDMMLRVWNCSTGKLMQCIQLELVVERISFSERGYIIRTEAGDIDIEHLKPLPWRKSARVSPPIDLFDVSHQWVVYQGERLLWLPSEYRATCWASNGETVAIGHASGYVTILQPDRGRPWILP